MLPRLICLASLLTFLPLHAETVVPPQTETDKRLPPKGGSWRLDEAKVTNESLPRVLLIGDSITNSYMAGVRKNLEDKANIDAWITPTTQADKSLPKTLEAMLSQHKYAVIHFNLGLHGWQPGRIPEGQYEPLTKAMVENLKKDAPQAKLIWATITPVTDKDHPDQLNAEIQPTIVQHNAMALKVMKEENVTIDDLSSLMLANVKLGKEGTKNDMFHWNAKGRDLLVKAVTESLLQALPAK